MRVFLLALLVAGATAQYRYNPVVGGSCSKSCPARHRCEIQTCEVCVEEDPTCETHECPDNFKCEDRTNGPVCVPNTCRDITCPETHKCVENSQLGAQCVPKTCADILCKSSYKCIETQNGPKCVPRTCDDLLCKSAEKCILTADGPKCETRTCDDISCKSAEKCLLTANGPVCAKKDCGDIDCPDTHKCVINFRGPQCVPKTCADIKCAAGEICDDGPDGPDCVPDVPSCKGFFCRRGTNCHIRDGSPICLPNTCFDRKCAPGLSCIDTPAGALCRRGQKSRGCEGKYCPQNSQCVDDKEQGPHCVRI